MANRGRNAGFEAVCLQKSSENPLLGASNFAHYFVVDAIAHLRRVLTFVKYSLTIWHVT
jgi:hypothetical protein